MHAIDVSHLLAAAGAAAVLSGCASSGGPSPAVGKASAPPPAHASAPSRGDAGFAALDANRDDTVSLDEAKARATGGPDFELVDQNDDGELSRDELRMALLTQPAPIDLLPH